MAEAAVTFVLGPSLSSPADLRRSLISLGLVPEFTGSVAGDSGVLPLAVLRGGKPPRIDPAPPDFRAVAILVVYNEADVISATVSHLASNGLGVYVVDNWSTDDTLELARRAAGEMLLGVERFPVGGPSPTFDLRDQLHRVEELAEGLGDCWIVSNDADELRFPPWEGVSLRDAYFHVQACGYNAVNYTTLNFALTSADRVRAVDLLRDFPYFDPQRTADLGQLNTWHQMPGKRVELASSGRHTVDFPDRRPFPYNFLLKHYPIRSVEQGFRKINKERVNRYRSDERVLNWHNHYRLVHRAEDLVSNPASLIRFDETFDERFLVERLTGVGFDPVPVRRTLKIALARRLQDRGLLDPLRRAKWGLERAVRGLLHRVGRGR